MKRTAFKYGCSASEHLRDILYNCVTNAIDVLIEIHQPSLILVEKILKGFVWVHKQLAKFANAAGKSDK